MNADCDSDANDIVIIENDFNFFLVFGLYKIEIHSLVHSFIHSFVHSFTRSFIHLFIIVYHFLYKIMPPRLKIKAPPVIISETPVAAVAVAPSSSATPSCRQFLSSLSPLEQRVCAIAESHLESSFDLSRSSGFIAWKAKNAS